MANLHYDGVIIAGPTGAKKSMIAEAFCRKYLPESSEIINADSLQLYDALPTITAHPDSKAMAAIPHKLYSVLPPFQEASVGWWLSQVHEVLFHTYSDNNFPVVVGGTGFYLKALLYGVSPIPSVSDEVREDTRELCKEIGTIALYDRLLQEDPEMGMLLNPNDTYRVIRAWEVLQETGYSLATWQKQSPTATVKEYLGKDVRWKVVIIDPPREELYERLEDRVEMMFQAGAIDEVRSLQSRARYHSLPVMKAIGAREISEFLNGNLTKDKAIELMKRATRQYAKRQKTWFRHQIKCDLRIEELPDENNQERILESVWDLVHPTNSLTG